MLWCTLKQRHGVINWNLKPFCSFSSISPLDTDSFISPTILHQNISKIYCYVIFESDPNEEPKVPATMLCSAVQPFSNNFQHMITPTVEFALKNSSNGNIAGGRHSIQANRGTHRGRYSNGISPHARSPQESNEQVDHGGVFIFNVSNNFIFWEAVATWVPHSNARAHCRK